MQRENQVFFHKIMVRFQIEMTSLLSANFDDGELSNLENKSNSLFKARQRSK